MKTCGKVEFSEEELVDVLAVEAEINETRKKFLAEVNKVSDMMEGPRPFLLDPDRCPVNKATDELALKLGDFTQKMTALEKQRNQLKEEGKLPSDW